MKMRATRQVLAVVAVTTALCADRAIPAAHASRTHVGEIAGRLVLRLARRFRRVVSAVAQWQERQRGMTQTRRPVLVPVPSFVAPRPVSPFQFRLPPPRI
jgi:hypothetical protein